MNKRPHSVTVISCLFLIAGLVGLAYHTTEFKAKVRFGRGAVKSGTELWSRVR